MAKRLIIIAALIAGGCTNQEPSNGSTDSSLRAPDPTHSGKRLQAQFFKNESGLKTFRRFWDSERAVGCLFRADAQGVLRCLPEESFQLQYSDAACTMAEWNSAVSVSAGSVDLPAYALALDGSDLLPVSVGAPLDARSGVYQRDASGNCAAAPLAIPSGYQRVVAAVTPADAGLFLSGKLIPWFAGGVRLFDHAVHASDGTVGYLGAGEHAFFDVRTGQSQTWATTAIKGDGAMNVVWAAAAGFIDFFADSACTVGVAELHGSGFTAGSLAVPRNPTLDGAACQFNATAFEVLNQPVSPVYAGGARGCMAVPPTPDDNFFSVGAPADLSHRVTGTTLRRAFGRLSTEELANSDGSHYSLPGLFDEVLHALCFPVQLSDASWVCAPKDTASVVFSDPQCTISVLEPMPTLAKVEDQACFAGTAYDVQVGADGQVTRYTRGPRASDQPIPLYRTVPGRSGTTCLPTAAAIVYTIAGQQLFPQAPLSAP